MSGLMNKLTGHHNKDHTTDTHQHGQHASPYTNNSNQQTTTTTTQTTTNNNALPNQSTNQQQTLGGMNNSANIASTAPYGASTATTTERTGAAYSNAGVQNQAYSNTGVNNQALANQQRGPLHDDAITRSEEQMRLAKATVETGVAALNKYVSVDHVEKQIPIVRERLVIERFPINESNIGSFSNAIIGEQHFETTVCEDRIAAMKEVVPIERIRLAKEVEGRVENVSMDLRKEKVDYQYQPYNAGAKNDDGLAHDAQARHDFSYDTHRKTDSSYDQAAQYDPNVPKPTSSEVKDSLPGTHHSGHGGMHGDSTNPLSDKIDNVGKTGHGIGAGFMQGNALASGGTGGA